MTEVYINQQRVFFKENTSLKLTIENTFFEDSGSYTLDVVFPLDIEQNRKVFGCVNRIDVTKVYSSFNASILVNSKLIFKGSAKITNISDTEVKVQMLSGNSHVKFWTKAEKMYIDEFNYEYTDRNDTFDEFVADDAFYGTPLIKAGSFPGKRGVYCYVPVKDANGSSPTDNSFKGLWNEHHLMINKDDQMVMYHGGTVDDPQYYIEINRQCIQPNLMFIAKWIFGHLGYTLRRNDRDNDFVNSIYIATATNTTTYRRHDHSSNSASENAMAKALPHWTVEEFMKQLQNFLCVKIVFNDIDSSVDIIDTIYNDGTIDITDDVQDEYEVEMIDNEDAKEMIYDSNVHYKKGSLGSEPRPDLVEPDMISAFRLLKFPSSYGVFSSFEQMSVEDRKRTIFEDTLNGRQYCSDNDGRMKLFNEFGGIVRNSGNDNNIELKISPVAIAMDVKMPVFEYDRPGGLIYRDAFNYRWEINQTVLFLENQYQAANHPSVWDAANGTSDEECQKEDVMQVFFMDGRGKATGFYTSKFQEPFTDFNLQEGFWMRAFSFALRRTDSWSIGGYHNKAKPQNRNAEHRFMFKAGSLPSVYSVFMVRNKQYACKKLEVQFVADGMGDIVTGYFEEIL